MRYQFAIISTLALACLLPALLHADSPRLSPSTPINQPSKHSCIVVHHIADWHAINNKSLVIWAHHQQQPYLVKISFACQQLKMGETLSIQSMDNQLCSQRSDAIWIDGKRCDGTVLSVAKISSQQAKELTGPTP